MILLFGACRNVVATSGGGGTSSASTGSTGTGGTGPCKDSMGFAVCGGPNNCPFGGQSGCQANACGLGMNILGPCTTSNYKVGGSAQSNCPDGNIYTGILDVTPIEHCLAFQFGPLYCENGSASVVHNADFSSFDCNETLPNPTTCPTVTGFQLCGPACGACPPDRVCTGRSPLHPYSVCMPGTVGSALTCDSATNCGSASGCFIFKDSAADQMFADQHGYCLPLGECMATAAGIPGGGKCVPGM